MIDISKLTEDDKKRTVIYRGFDGTPPEYGNIVKWSGKKIWIMFNGDNQFYEVYPGELTYKDGR